MKTYRATLLNGTQVAFKAKDSDSAMDMGNAKAKKSRTTMIAITIIKD